MEKAYFAYEDWNQRRNILYAIDALVFGLIALTTIVDLLVLYRLSNKDDRLYPIWHKDKLLVVMVFYFLMKVSIFTFVQSWYGDGSIYIENNLLIIFLFGTLIPIGIIIYRKIILGEEKDAAAELRKLKFIQSSNLHSLEKLLNAGVLSQIEYEKKVSQLNADLYRKEFMLSKEYEELLKLVRKGVYSNEELQLKIHEIVNDKLKKN